jgi:CheY-like chemotaxis protein
MRILLAVDHDVLQAAVCAALEPEGHEVVVVRDGFQAMAAFREQAPDLLLTVHDLDGISGLELARLTRLGSRQRFVPVLMFSDAFQPEFFRLSLEAGVMEFIARSFEPGELRCRVGTIARLVRLQNRLVAGQALHEEELDLVKHMLARLAGTDAGSAAPGFHMETVQTRRVNGDAIVYRETIPGVHFGMICDATGHGLMAGISTIPVMETFLGMVVRDLPLATIYGEIHDKLRHLLPTGRFACLLLLRLNVAQGVLSVLNAGMPDVQLLRTGGNVQVFPSRVLPAGIEGVDPGVVVIEAGVAAGDRILAFSDGLGDLTTPEEITRRYLREPFPLSHRDHCQAIRNLVSEASLREDYRDDLSWALWEVPGKAVPPAVPGAGPAEPAGVLVPGFEASFRLNPRIHAPRDVLPHVLSLIIGFKVSHAQTQLFGMLLTEALTNAVEHGLLRLDSNLKAQGFEAFEEHRRVALEGLEEGAVRFTITLYHAEGPPPHPIRRIRAEVEDTGPGFDWRARAQAQADDGSRPFGRGIALLQCLARDVVFNEAGNRVSFSLECS